MDITIKEAIKIGMNLDFVEREYEIQQAEEWVPEQQYWSKIKDQSGVELQKSVSNILTKWTLNEYSKRY